MTTSVIFNCSNAVRGGALKNAILFIEHSFNDSTVTWFYLVNQKVLDQCPMLQSLPSCRYRVIRHKLSANPFQYLVSLFVFSHLFPARIMYSMAGPIFIPYFFTHYMGVSDPYIIFGDKSIFSIGRSKYEAFKTLLETKFKRFFVNWSNFYLFQTESSLDSFSRRYHKDRSVLFHVPNAFDENLLFKSSLNDETLTDCSRAIPSNPDLSLIDIKSLEEFRQFISNYGLRLGHLRLILIPGAPYSHKAHFLLPEIIDSFAKLVPHSSNKFLFLVTVPPGSDVATKLYNSLSKKHLPDNILLANYGSYDYNSLLKLMKLTSVCFIPSLLEVFSASYLEALLFEKPLVVSNTPFALDICKDAALYVDPYSAQSTALAIYSLLESPQLQRHLASRCSVVLSGYPTQRERYELARNTILAL